MKQVLIPLCLGLVTTPVWAAGLCPLVQDLNAFVAQETRYHPEKRCPEIGFSELPPGEGLRSQAGAFLPDTGRIELAPDLDLAGASGQSYLLHELVHAAQYANGAQYRAPCPAALEAEAYRVQAQFLRLHGLGQEAVLTLILSNELGRCSRADDS